MQKVIRKIRRRDKVTKSGFNVSDLERLRKRADAYRKKNGQKLSREERRMYILTGKLPDK